MPGTSRAARAAPDDEKSGSFQQQAESLPSSTQTESSCEVAAYKDTWLAICSVARRFEHLQMGCTFRPGRCVDGNQPSCRSTTDTATLAGFSCSSSRAHGQDIGVRRTRICYTSCAGALVTGAAACATQADALEQEQKKTKVLILGTGWGATSFLNALKLKNSKHCAPARPLDCAPLSVDSFARCWPYYCRGGQNHSYFKGLLIEGLILSCLRRFGIRCTGCIATQLLPLQVLQVSLIFTIRVD